MSDGLQYSYGIVLARGTPTHSQAPCPCVWQTRRQAGQHDYQCAMPLLPARARHPSIHPSIGVAGLAAFASARRPDSFQYFPSSFIY